MSERFNCPCDEFVFPEALAIQAGLDRLPRQIARFPEFRRAMLVGVAGKPPLDDWRARNGDDLGLMLLEFGAYVFDVIAFYDEVGAHEGFLRTAQLRPSLRKLVGLLGYVPRPAVASAVSLAIFAEGRKLVSLPADTAFRSGAFDGQPPQVFELTAPTSAHPLTNRWTLARPTQTVVGSGTVLLLDPGTARLKKDDIVLLRATSAITVRTVATVEPFQDIDRKKYERVTFSTSLGLPSVTPNQITAASPTQTASLWTMPKIGSDPSAIETVNGVTRLTLDSLYRQIKPNEYVILSKGTAHRWFQVTQTSEQRMTVMAAGSVTTKNADNSTVTVEVPAVQVPVTQLILDAEINASSRKAPGDTATWTNSDASTIVVRYALVDGGIVTAQPESSVDSGDTLTIAGPIGAPADGTSPSTLMFEDLNGDGVVSGGTVNFATSVITLDQNADWETPLAAPVEVYGNVVAASRGETVAREVLGSGDASLPSQSFTLKKKPLTYVSAPTSGNESGLASTLQIYIDGVRWTEVPSFFGISKDDQVYIVRENDRGEAVITFDGRRASPVPTGTSNVVATYRFGAGAAAPPAGSITQIAKPVPGLTSVRNPVAAAGGADAEGPDSLRTSAPKSALLLGRAVSIQDMEAVALAVPGVRAVHVEWRWHGAKQRPVVQVWYVGESGLELTVIQTIRQLSDDTTPIDVDPAQGVPATLSLDIEPDPRYVEADVLDAVGSVLLEPESGLLTPERIGIGTPLYRSRILEAAMGVTGVVSVRSILWNGTPFAEYALKPDAGTYFDLEEGSLVLNGTEANVG
jgi:hypothetical protein